MSQEGTAPGPLDGIRVLEFSQVVAGPACGRILAELGAEVLKIEPLDGDPYRNTFNTIPDEGKRFQSLNLGKKSVAINLQAQAGQLLVKRLAEQADVVLTNFRYGVPERLGFGYEELSNLNPRLVYCRITGFGTRSEAAARPASDPMMQAYSGLMAGSGKVNDEGMPMVATNTIADYAAGMGAAIGILAALYARRESGRGQLVDSSLLRAALVLQDTAVMREPVYDRVIRDPLVEAMERVIADGGAYTDVLAIRQGTNRRNLPPSAQLYGGSYPAKDGVIMLGPLTPANREAARRVVGLTKEDEATVADASLPGHADRIAALKQRIRDLLATRTVAEWVEVLEREGCPAAPVNYPELMADDPIVTAEGLMVDLVHEVTGPQRVVAPLVELSETPTRIQHPATTLGKYTRHALADAGISEAEIEALLQAGVIRQYVAPTETAMPPARSV